MTPPTRSHDHLPALVVVLIAAATLWWWHASALDLGRSTPLLNAEGAQHAVVARELGWRGALASPCATPLELLSHANPPWPAVTSPPGSALLGALVLLLVPAQGVNAGSDPRAWLLLMAPFVSYLMLGAAFTIGSRRLLLRVAPDLSRGVAVALAAAIGLSVVLDPEVQRLALANVPDLPFALLWVAALAGLVRGAGHAQPFAYGLLLGALGLFRIDALWLAPLGALATLADAPTGTRLRVAVRLTLGVLLPIAPWVVHQLRTTGSPVNDLSRLALWDRVEGRELFVMLHRPVTPDLPTGAAAWAAIATKVVRGLGDAFAPLFLGPRGLWLGALVAWLLTRPARALAWTGSVALVAVVAGAVATAATGTAFRHLFPVRLTLEAAGLLALLALLTRIPGSSPALRRALALVTVAMALGWGAWRTTAALAFTREDATVRTSPASSTLTALSIELNSVLKPGETVMSNLGAVLAWHTNHPVIELADSPEDVTGCRARHEFHHLLLVFRDADQAWGGWRAFVEREGAGQALPTLGVTEEKRYRTRDGFVVVWLKLGPREPLLAARR
jgi:hypothetical protein